MREITIGERQTRRHLQSWIAPFFMGGDLQRRITLIGLAIVLQSMIELPREVLRLALGPFTALGTNLLLALSLVILLYAIMSPDRSAQQAPTTGPHQAHPTHLLTRSVLTICIAIALAVGTHQLTAAIQASFTQPLYTNDGTTLDHYAAQLVLQGQDPYEKTTAVEATRVLHQRGQYTTPLRQGQFAQYDWRQYPSRAIMDALMAHYHTIGTNVQAPEFESHVSYPAFSFLVLLPFVMMGLPSVILCTLLCYILFAIVALRAVDRRLRPWVFLLLVADAPVLDGLAIGALDIVVMLLVLVMWLYWQRPVIATLALGLALATKQQAWFYAIFLGIFLLQRLGWRQTLLRFSGAGAIFLAINAPFMIHNPTAWLAGIRAPFSDPMFPAGSGLVGLGLGAHMLALWPQFVYTMLMLMALLVAIVWYAKVGARRYPASGILLAMLPLWFAWRSLPTYFHYSVLPMTIVWLVWQQHAFSRTSRPDLDQGTLARTFADGARIAVVDKTPVLVATRFGLRVTERPLVGRTKRPSQGEALMTYSGRASSTLLYAED